MSTMKNEEYIDINKIAELKGLKSNRSLRLAIQKGKYIAREVKVFGGKSYEILYSSLEPEIQEKFQDELIKEATQSNCTALVPINNINNKNFITESAKLTALARVDIVKALQNMRAKYKTKKEADSIFLDLYNSGMYPSLQELYLSGEVNLEDWNYIIKSLFSLHKKFEKFKGETNPDAIKWLYYDKTKERLSDLRAQNPYWNEVLDREFEYINGKKYRGIASLKSGIDIYVQKLCKTGKETVIHGDYCFSNILFDSSNYNFKLVDPRGRLNNEPTIYGDPRYDIAKLRHSIAGFYDFIVHGLFRLKENKTGFEYEIKTSVDYSILEMIFNKYAELNGYNPQEIKFIEGLLFLSMIPLHKDNFSRQKVFYLKAIELLNDTVKIRGKLNNEKVLSLVRSRG